MRCVEAARDELVELVFGCEGGTNAMVGLKIGLVSRRGLVDGPEACEFELAHVGRYKSWGGATRRGGR